MTFSDGLTLNRQQMKVCGFGPITEQVRHSSENMLAKLNWKQKIKKSPFEFLLLLEKMSLVA